MEYWQHILAYAALGLALFYLVRRFFWKPKKKNDGCGSEDCGCH